MLWLIILRDIDHAIKTFMIRFLKYLWDKYAYGMSGPNFQEPLTLEQWKEHHREEKFREWVRRGPRQRLKATGLPIHRRGRVTLEEYVALIGGPVKNLERGVYAG